MGAQTTDIRGDFKGAAARVAEVVRTVDKHGNITYRDREGFLHRDDGPAIVDIAGHESWWQHGAHWPDGPRIVAERKKIAEERERARQEEQRSADLKKIEDICRNGLSYDIIIEKPFIPKPKDDPEGDPAP